MNKNESFFTETINPCVLNLSVAGEEFEWPKYKTDNARIKALSAKYKNVTCANAFAQEYGIDLPDIGSDAVRKDFVPGESVKIIDINGHAGTVVFFKIEGDILAEIDIQKEKRFLDLFNISAKDFAENIEHKEFRDEFLRQNNTAIIVETKPQLKLSLMEGFKESTKQDFFREIKNPKNAYVAKIISKNHGGFIVDVCGVQAFLPGSLAAANKIIDFDSYIGKKVNVMIEDWMPEIKTFIVSHKKYLEYALPSIIAQYDWSQKHKGIVTGTNKYGVFVEFYEAITGLLHSYKMNEDSKKRFEANGFKPGDEIECYVHDIQNNKLILTDFVPGSAEDMIQVGSEHVGKVTNVTKFGFFLKLKTGEDGVIKSGKNTKPHRRGDIVKVKVSEVTEDGKIYFEEIQ